MCSVGSCSSHCVECSVASWSKIFPCWLWATREKAKKKECFGFKYLVLLLHQPCGEREKKKTLLGNWNIKKVIMYKLVGKNGKKPKMCC